MTRPSSKPPRGNAGDRVIVIPVPWTAEPAVFDRAFAERTALIGTVIVQRPVLSFEVCEAYGHQAGCHRFHPAVR